MKSNLKKLRKEAGLTLQQLGDLAGVCKSQIHELEKDDCNPSFVNAARIASILKVSAYDIWIQVGLPKRKNNVTLAKTREGQSR